MKRPLYYWYAHVLDARDFVKAVTYATEPARHHYRDMITAGPPSGGFTWACAPEGHGYWRKRLRIPRDGDGPKAYLPYYMNLPFPVFRLMAEHDEFPPVVLPLGRDDWTPVCWDPLLIDPKMTVVEYKTMVNTVAHQQAYRHLQYGWIEKDHIHLVSGLTATLE